MDLWAECKAIFRARLEDVVPPPRVRCMWEIVGYFTLALACIACALVLGSWTGWRVCASVSCIS